MKNKLIIGIVMIAVLAFAFWYGGDSPGSRGWEVSPVPTVKNTTAAPQNITVAPTAAAETTENTAAAIEAPTESTQASTEATANTDPDAGKDKYNTEPVPEGKPRPVEPQESVTGTDAYTCTISISCSTILDNMDYCDENKRQLVPENGWLLEPATVTFYEGESVFNVLMRTCKQNKLHMEYMDMPIYNSAYIEGIGNLYEFDVGELSGWMYKVNGWYPNYGCSRYQLADGDVIEWVYTCDMGEDIGGGYASRNQ